MSRRRQVLKDCKVCEHPEKRALEECLDQGRPYKELKTQYRVSIGTLRRHRQGHMSREATAAGVNSQIDEEVYLRFGAPPEGGLSWNSRDEVHEEGLSVFKARRNPKGGYTVEIPRDIEEVQQFRQTEKLAESMAQNRPA